MTKQQELTRKEIASLLYKAAHKFFKVFRDFRSSITFKEVHLTDSLRVDILNLSYSDKIVIIELKSCRQDFEGDNKWKGYLDYCDRFFFMCPEGVIDPKELPPKIGLVYVNLNNKEDPYFKVIKKPGELKPKYVTGTWLKHIYKKLAFRKFVNYQGQMVSLELEKLF